MYYSDRPREIEAADKVNIVCLDVRDGMFLRTTYQDQINLKTYNPASLPSGNFYFLVHLIDKFNSNLVLNYRNPEDFPESGIKIDDPETWGRGVKDDVFIPELIVKLVTEKRVKILAHNDHINIDDRFTDRWIRWVCHLNPGVNYDDFVFLTPCTGNSRFPVIDNTTWAQAIVNKLLEVPDLLGRARQAIETGQIKKHKFISLNGRPTMHRQIAVTRLFNYRDDGILTFSESLGRSGDQGLEIAGKPDQSIAARYREIQPHFPLSWDIKEKDHYSLAANLEMSDSYINENLDTYLNIVSETRFYNITPVWFSEKTFRAMMFLQPFVVLGAAGLLQALRDRGYQTFGRWINESYDSIDDDVDRCHQALTSAIEFFSTKTQEELSEVIKEMLPVLMHNYHCLIAEYNSSAARITNQLIFFLSDNYEENNSCNPLVYNPRKTQHGITMTPYAVPDFKKVFKPIAYPEGNNSLPDTFYYQLDRALLDISWMKVINTAQFTSVHLNNFYQSLGDVPHEVKLAVVSGRAKFVVYDWGNLNSVSDFQLLVDTIVDGFARDGYTVSQDRFVIVSNIGWQGSKLNFVSFNFWETYYTEKFDQAMPGLTPKIADAIRRKQPRKNKFICLNGQYSNSRLATVTLLSDLQDQGILTLVNSTQPLLAESNHIIDKIAEFGNFSPELAHQFGKELAHQLPWHWDIDLRTDYTNVSWDWAYDTQRLWTLEKEHVDSALDCYLNIITESNYQYNGMVRHTEKVFKAINLLQPFVVIAEPGYLASLQTQGYRTFGRWIDESYDTIGDPLVRIFSAVESAREFIQKDHSELAEILEEMLPVLLHNKKFAQYRQRTAWSRLEIELARTLAR